MRIADLIAALQSGMDPNKAVVQASMQAALPGGDQPDASPGLTPPIANVPPTPDTAFPPPAPPPPVPPVPIPTTPEGVKTPFTNPALPTDAPKAMQSPPDLANMYIKLMQQNQNAALLDSGATLIAAGFSKYPGTREALIRASAGGGRSGLGITAADLINIEKQQQSMRDTLLRRSLLGGLAKQYKLSPEAALALETSGKLDEVIKHHETQNLQVIEDNATGQKSFYDHRGNKLADIGGPKPEEGEFQEGPGGRQLVSKRTGLPMGPGLGQPPKTQVVEGVLGPELRDTTPGGTFTKLGGSAGIKPTEATRADAEMVDLLNEGRPDDQKIGMEYFLTNIKRNPQLAPNAKNIADWKAVNAGRSPDNQMGYEEFMRRFGGSGVTVNVGKDGTPFPAPPPGQAYRRDGNNVLTDDKGEPQLYDLPGGDAALAREEQRAKLDKTKQEILKGERDTKKATETEIEKARSRYSAVSSVYAATENVEKIMKDAPFYAPATGFGSGPFTMFGSTPATNVRAQLKTIDANTAFAQLQSMRDASQTGAALGPVSDFENKMLSSTIASIDPSQSDELILKGLRRIRATMTVLAERNFTEEAGKDGAKALQLYEEALQKEMARLENRDTKVKGDDVRRVK